MSETVIDRMSKDLANARNWATLMAERCWQLEDAIAAHRGMVRSPAEADLRLYQLLEVVDDDV